MIGPDVDPSYSTPLPSQLPQATMHRPLLLCMLLHVIYVSGLYDGVTGKGFGKQ